MSKVLHFAQRNDVKPAKWLCGFVWTVFLQIKKQQKKNQQTFK